MSSFSVPTEGIMDLMVEGVSMRCPTCSPDPTPWPICKNVCAPNTVKQLPKFVGMQHLEPFWKEKVTFFIFNKSLGTKGLLYPRLPRLERRLRARWWSPPCWPAVPGVTLGRRTIKINNRLICRVHGSVSKVWMGSLLEGERISS